MLPSTSKQKLFRVGFWTLLLYIAVTSTVVIAIQFQLIPVPEKSLAKEEPKSTQTNAINLSETSFAKLFAREFFSWSTQDEQSRIVRLEPFWAENMDKQGNIDIKNAEWDSYPQNIDVWKIENRPGSKDIKEVTIYAETVLTKVGNEEMQKRIDRYMVVPIKRAGDSYRVVDTPYFIAPPVASKLPKSKQADEDGEQVDLSVKNGIEKFLPDFWKSYTSDSPAEISYLMKGDKTPSTLAGLMTFVDSTKIEVTQKDNYYQVDTDVKLQDIASKAIVSYHYQLKLVKEKNRWFVLDIKQGEGL